MMFTTPITATDELHKQACDLLSRTIVAFSQLIEITAEDKNKFVGECEKLKSQCEDLDDVDEFLAPLETFFDTYTCLFVEDVDSANDFISKLNKQYLFSQERDDVFLFDEEKESVIKVELFTEDKSIFLESADHEKFEAFPEAVQECLKKYLDYALTEPDKKDDVKALNVSKSPAIPIRAKSLDRKGFTSSNVMPMARSYGLSFQPGKPFQGNGDKPESGADLMQKFHMARQFTKK